MPPPPPVPGPAAPGDDRLTDLRTLGEQLPRFIRLVHALKSSPSAEGRDRAALTLLFPLERVGPLRQSALAELVHADPSTVSRHVAALIEQGLVRRVADETDGRASRLVVTDAGRRAMAQVRAEREAHLARATAGWTAADLGTLARLFGRLLDDLSASLPAEPHTVPVDASPREKS
ncbi:transcriptional regulator, MarR family [Geodermatophilus pulveris]|uniref:Transcriptional regulator, MarR family n=1 Tax=Geodermatophilus pulveris TaxID=1564159 RepID=A0A239AK29_9ACTN|nr:MarR family transcriptional regulator [Geodermatophilus pulveris]SNR95273.1 transcriptional regulator, MarR family [Geodermatophilus pulveris]